MNNLVTAVLFGTCFVLNYNSIQGQRIDDTGSNQKFCFALDSMLLGGNPLLVGDKVRSGAAL